MVVVSLPPDRYPGGLEQIVGHLAGQVSALLQQWSQFVARVQAGGANKETVKHATANIELSKQLPGPIGLTSVTGMTTLMDLLAHVYDKLKPQSSVKRKDLAWLLPPMVNMLAKLWPILEAVLRHFKVGSRPCLLCDVSFPLLG